MVEDSKERIRAPPARGKNEYARRRKSDFRKTKTSSTFFQLLFFSLFSLATVALLLSNYVLQRFLFVLVHATRVSATRAGVDSSGRSGLAPCVGGRNERQRRVRHLGQADWCFENWGHPSREGDTDPVQKGMKKMFVFYMVFQSEILRMFNILKFILYQIQWVFIFKPEPKFWYIITIIWSVVNIIVCDSIIFYDVLISRYSPGLLY